MELHMFYKEKSGRHIAHIPEYPDYESQGNSLDELRESLIAIFNDIDEGLVPDAEPLQLMKVAV